MIKIESTTLEICYEKAADALQCSVIELEIEIIQLPKSGILGLFKKPAIIVATKKASTEPNSEPQEVEEAKNVSLAEVAETSPSEQSETKSAAADSASTQRESDEPAVRFQDDIILPEAFSTTQDEYEDEYEEHYDDDFSEEGVSDDQMVQEIEQELNRLFAMLCFDLDPIVVAMYDENSVEVLFSGKDAALLIGKEGYRYKALSYLIFNWINAKYQVQLRLEIAQFLKNQEEAISKYLVNVIENVERDGTSQTKVLDGVLVQIALQQLRERFPNKYVAIRSTRDGAKFIIINDYNEY